MDSPPGPRVGFVAKPSILGSFSYNPVRRDYGGLDSLLCDSAAGAR